ncbi:hypothetical protein [Microbaculum marinisediminis]|uniref:Helix-turn-helix domain-containing protein n=1 Tax=Microbaculum marinisediminis TaxID=2931392 RepID=A0AAW5QSZ4_9HYPH|nr:hypothetical protein [Microbaculum sp. A6E488]MCT8971226.1 hypothetical protein [Microbaculum sp. A6E488]
MPTGHTVTRDDRALMRALYEGEPEMTVVEIARTIGVNRATVFDYARQNGWVRAKRGPGPKAAGPAIEPSNRRAVLNTLWLAATRQVLALAATGGAASKGGGGEGGDNGSGASGASDAHGTPGATVDAQALMAAVRTVEKLIDMDNADARGAAAAAAATAAPADEGPVDIDDFRNEIARRIENIVRGDDD